MLTNPEATERFLRDLPSRLARLEADNKQLLARVALLEAQAPPAESLEEQVKEVLAPHGAEVN